MTLLLLQLFIHTHLIPVKTAEVWCPFMFEGSGIHSFVPVDRLVCRCMHGLRNVGNETVLLIVPLGE